MKFRNVSDCPVSCADLHIVGLAPGECVEIPQSYAAPRLASNGSRYPAIIEMLCPQLRPADAEMLAQWLRAPGEPEAPKAPTPRAPTTIMADEGVSEGVAEQLAALEREKMQPEAPAAAAETVKRSPGRPRKVQGESAA